MNYQQDSSSDDFPYLPPEKYVSYEEERNNRLSQASLSQPEQRRGRSHFSEEELQELDYPSPFVDIPINSDDDPSNINSTNTVPPLFNVLRSPTNDSQLNNNTLQTSTRYHNGYNNGPAQSTIPLPPHAYHISWGRRTIGIILVLIPAAFISTAAHFIDWPMNDFQLFSASFFIFQGVFWPSFGILLIDLFCTAKKPKNDPISTTMYKPNDNEKAKSKFHKWIVFVCAILHSNFTSVAIILLILSIQKLNISISLALSFGFDVVVVLIRYILNKGTCSLELIIMSIISYAGFAVTAVPAFIDSDHDRRKDVAIGVGASIGVMLLSIPSSLLLAKLRKEKVPESALGASFGFFGCIHSLITKQIMASTFNLRLDGRSIGWAAGLISVMFLGTIFLFLESKLSSLIWQRDDDDRPREYSSITRTRIAVFILSSIWELSRQGFRETAPDPYDIMGGFLVMISFLLASGYQAWSKSCQNEKHVTTDYPSAAVAGVSSRSSPKFCAFIPWLFTRQRYHFNTEK